MHSRRVKEAVDELLARSDAHVFRYVINAVPNAIFLADEETMVVDLNLAASKMIGGEARALDKPLCGEVLRCVNARDAGDGCGTSKSCETCVVRLAIKQACQGHGVHRKYTHMRLVSDGRVRVRHFLATAVPFQHIGVRFALLTLEDITDVLQLGEARM
jgi:PAS domain-containing protein